MPRADELLTAGAEEQAEHLALYKHLTHFAAANTGTGTNHVAVYGNAVYRVGELLGREDLVQLAEDIWVPLARDMDPEGYWAEATGGPAVGYNNLTLVCCGRMWRWTGKEVYREAALSSALFHQQFCFPDGNGLDSFDGRQRYHPGRVNMWASFVHSETPLGRGFVAHKMKALRAHQPAGDGAGGQLLANLCEDHELWVGGPVEEAVCAQDSYVHTLDAGRGGVRREGSWCFTLQGITHLPIGGGFFVDRSSPFSLWHEKVGLIVNGSGDPDEHAAQMFKIKPIYARASYSIPESVSLDMGKAGESGRLTAEYRGGTGHLEVNVESDDRLRLTARAGVRADRYPVELTLQLELRAGDTVSGVELGEEEVRLTESKLNGVVEGEHFKVTFPASKAKLVWPHLPYHPYRDPHAPKNTWVSLLHLPMGPEGIEVLFEIL
jgi:hypothetical protein